jgi:hypothetical protein
MASPNAPRATYFGQGNRGFATVLKYTEEDPYLKTLIDIEKDKIATRQKKDDEAFALIKDLDKPYYPYQEQVTGQLKEILEDYSSGRIKDRFALASRVQDVKGLINTSNAVETSFNNGVKVYEKDDEVNYGVYQPFAVRDLLNQASTGKMPTDINFEDSITTDNALDVLDVQKVVNNIATNLGTQIQTFADTKDLKNAPPGFGGLLTTTTSINARDFIDFTTDANGNTTAVLKDPSKLPQDYYKNLINNNSRFKKAAIANIIQKDPTRKGTSFTEDEIIESGKSLLITYGKGAPKFEEQQKTDLRAKPVPRTPTAPRTTTTKPPTDEELKSLWFNDLTKGDDVAKKNAADFLRPITKDQGVTINYNALRDITEKEGADIKVIPVESKNFERLKRIGDRLSSYYINSDDFKNNDFSITDVRIENGKLFVYLRVKRKVSGPDLLPSGIGKTDNLLPGNIVKIPLDKNVTKEALSPIYTDMFTKKGVNYGKGQGTGEISEEEETTPTPTTTTKPTTYVPPKI